MKITPSITRFFSGSKIITRLSARTTTRDNSPSITRTCFVEFEKRWWNTILVLLRMRWGSLTCAYLGRGILYIASPSHIPSLLSSSPTLFIYSLTSTPNLSYPLIYLLIYFSYLLLFFFLYFLSFSLLHLSLASLFPSPFKIFHSTQNIFNIFHFYFHFYYIYLHLKYFKHVYLGHFTFYLCLLYLNLLLLHLYFFFSFLASFRLSPGLSLTLLFSALAFSVSA